MKNFKGGYQIIDFDYLVYLKTNSKKDIEVYEQAKSGKPILGVSATNGLVIWCTGKVETNGSVSIYSMTDFSTPAYVVGTDGSVSSSIN